MVDNHLIFLVTIPIHYGSNEGSLHGKAAKPSAEKGSWTIQAGWVKKEWQHWQKYKIRQT